MNPCLLMGVASWSPLRLSFHASNRSIRTRDIRHDFKWILPAAGLYSGSCPPCQRSHGYKKSADRSFPIVATSFGSASSAFGRPPPGPASVLSPALQGSAHGSSPAPALRWTPAAIPPPPKTAPANRGTPLGGCDRQRPNPSVA